MNKQSKKNRKKLNEYSLLGLISFFLSISSVLLFLTGLLIAFKVSEEIILSGYFAWVAIMVSLIGLIFSYFSLKDEDKLFLFTYISIVAHILLLLTYGILVIMGNRIK